jgi:hypothetical protein
VFRGLACILPAVVALGVAGCERDPLPWICPDLAPGELVITELRGPQSGSDTRGQWIELYNASGTELDLYGLEVRLKRLDGSSPARILVRVDQVLVPAAGYAVLGRFATGQEPAHVDYGYQLDFSPNLYDSAAIDVMACGQLIDHVNFRGLPGVGTRSFDGNLTPDAAANDDEDNWCVDAVPDGSTIELGVPGTPGEPNRPCES